MYDFITGQLVKTSKDAAVVEANGIGYRIFITAACAQKLSFSNARSSITLYVSFVVREFSHAFYGFPQEGERDLFESLLTITGIGPKTALGIIGHLSFEELTDALMKKDLQTLCKVPGIGKKTAERLFIELKDTLPLLASLSSGAKTPLSHDAVSALMNLGYNNATAQKAVKKVLETHSDATADLSTLITLSLKHI